MANDKSSTGKGAPQSSAGKRPYATLDLKATEIKTAEAASKAAAAETPRPAAASSYATAASNDASLKNAKTQPPSNDSTKTRNGSAASGAPAATKPGAGSNDKPAGFAGSLVSHVAAGVVGGAVMLLASYWLLPRLGDNTSRLTADTSALSQRLSAVEKSERRNAAASDVSALEGRVADLEKTAQTIPALTDRQRQLVAETKAALASAASDAGSPQLIERVGKVEDKLKALAEAGANDPNSNHLQQLAALTGKVSDLQTSLATQLSALRAGVTKDVESRTQAATQASEAARAGTERIDKDVSELKNKTAALQQSTNDAKAANDRLAADLKATQEGTAQLKAAFETLKTAAAKPADISAAIAPVSGRIATLEKSVQDVVQADAARKEDAKRVVLAIELQNLKRTLDSGQKYAAELAQLKKVAGSTVDLSALTKLQDTGVPSLIDLKADFRTTAAKAIDAGSEEEDTSVLGRLWTEAKSVVRVRRIDLKPEDKSTEATIGRMQIALNDGRLNDVLDEAKDLPPAAADAAKPFLDKVAARVSVDRALASLQAQLKSSIASGSEPTQKTP